MNKKGFTLIELLAVIVILAIIALIATPIIIGIINDAKKQSNQRSAELYLKAAELAIARKNLTAELGDTTCEVQSQEDSENNLEIGDLMCGTTPVKVEMDGEKPKSGKITFSNGKISSVTGLAISGQTYKMDLSGKLIVIDGTNSTDDTYLKSDGCYKYVTKDIESFEIVPGTCEAAVKDIILRELDEEWDDEDYEEICSDSDEIEDMTSDIRYFKHELADLGAINVSQSSNLSGAKIVSYTCPSTQINIPQTLNGVTVTGIAGEAFVRKNLTQVTIPNGVVSIEESAFNRNKLTEINIPDSVTIIGRYAFDCNNITNVEIGRGIQYIGESAFGTGTETDYDLHIDLYGPNQLETVKINNYESSVELDDYAFYGFNISNIQWKTD